MIIPPSVLASFERSTTKTVEQQTQKLIVNAEKQFASLKPVIEQYKPSSVLDIGCGLAGVDVLLAKAGVKRIVLLDGWGQGIKQHGFSEPAEPWGDVRLGADLVAANSPNADVRPFVPEVAKYMSEEVAKHSSGLNMIISLRSWGHHYPVSTYLKLAKECLPTGGIVVLDIRSGTNGKAELEANGFSYVQQLEDDSLKCQRLVFKKE